MKFFGIFFAALTLIAGFFWLTDDAGSGMAWATGIFAALGILGFVLDARRAKSLNDKAAK
ncbi:MAG: hypothetical protein JWR44_2440 [Hymenobacter sp.]|jgi:hypothetical protein|nr:hypothetical protein [Hymenobacter sp.]